MTYEYAQDDVWHNIAGHANKYTDEGWELIHTFAKESPGNFLLVFRREKRMVDVTVSQYRAEMFARGEITFEGLTGHPISEVGTLSVTHDVDMAREAAKAHDLWKLIEDYADSAANYTNEMDAGTSKTAEITAKLEWIAARDAVRLKIGLDVEEVLPLYPNSGSVVDRSYHENKS